MPIVVIKILVIVILLVIIGSLASALVFLYRDRGQEARTVRALTLRIGLSIGLFLLLMAGIFFGIIPPTGLR